MRRLCAIILLLLLSTVPAAHTVLSGEPAPFSCPSLSVSSSPLIITAPADGSAFSSTVPLAVAPPTDGAASITVCASLRGTNGQPTTIPIASLDGTTSWSATWDTSPFASQSNVVLSFFASYATGPTPIVLIGQRTIAIDRAAPSSTLTLIGPGQYTAPDGTLFVAGSTQISLAATDPPLDDGTPGSGPWLYTSADGGPTSPYVAPFGLQGLSDGPHSIAYWAIDRAGNSETPRTLSLALDTQPPSVMLLITGTLNPDGSYASAVTVALPANDAGSGLRRVCYLLAPTPDKTIYCGPDTKNIYTPGQEITIGATTWFGYTALDNVGNGFDGSLAITITTPTPASQPATPTLPAPTAAASATRTARPTAIATATHTPRPTVSPTATRTPRPTPTWRPIDGPPILRRETPPVPPTVVAGQGVVHVHMMPPRRTTRTKAVRCTTTRPCPKPSRKKRQH